MIPVTRSQTTSRRKRTVVDEAKKPEVKNNVMDFGPEQHEKSGPIAGGKSGPTAGEKSGPTAG